MSVRPYVRPFRHFLLKIMRPHQQQQQRSNSSSDAAVDQEKFTHGKNTTKAEALSSLLLGLLCHHHHHYHCHYHGRRRYRRRCHRFYPRDAMLARTSYGPVSICLSVCLSVSVCVCLSQVGVLSKGMNGLIWFLAWRLFRPVLHCVLRKFRHLQK